MPQRTRFGLPFVLSVAATMLAAAMPAVAQPKVLKVVPHADLKVVDGYQTTATITSMHMGAVYDTLFSWDENVEGQPQMVERWTLSDDKLKYTMTLRPGLKFHDGQAVTSKDVVASLRRLVRREVLGRSIAPFLASVDAVDDRTFTLTMKEPFGLLLYAIGGLPNLEGIYREKDALIDPSTPITETIGSGPFKFNRAEWVPGSKVVYDRNTDYVPRAEKPSNFAGGKIVKVDRVEYKVIPDGATAVAALAAGEVDFVDQPSLELVQTIEKNPDVVVGTVWPIPGFGVLRPNHLHPPFNNLKARQALALMVDQREYMAVAKGPEKYWHECFSLWICNTPYGSEAGAEPYRKQNLERARQLMKEAGYNGEKVVVLGAADIAYIHAFAIMTAENLKKIGVNAELVISDWGTTITRRENKSPPDQGGWSIFHTGSGSASGASPLSNNMTPTTCERAWFGWPCDAEAEKLRQQFIRETDGPKQKDIALRLHKHLWEANVPYVPLGQYQQPFLWRKNVSGVLRTNTLVWWNIEKN
jgi:peptide/nickel transport system substrate-binding protein